jgi:hypothetical protein
MARQPPRNKARNKPPRDTRSQKRAARSATRRRRSAAERDPAPDVPPHNIEAEQALLGAILVNNVAYHRVSDFLLAEHFAEGRHGRIFAAIAKLIERGQVADPMTLKSLLDQDDALVEIGGEKYLERVATSMVTIINAGDYGRTIYDLWKQRELSARTSPSAPPTDWAQERAAMLERLGAIETALQQLASIVDVGQTTHGGIGHNLPSEPLPVDASQIRMGISAANVIRIELSEERPRPEVLRLCGLTLKHVCKGVVGLLHWATAKGDAFVETFVKSAGTAAGKTIIGAAALKILLEQLGIDLTDAIALLERWAGLL